jgi:hypothetical protein
MRMAEVPAAKAAGLLEIAERSLKYLDSVSRAGAGPASTAAQRELATRSRACLDALAPLAAPLDSVIAELRAAVAGGRPAGISAAQAAAIEEYATCAVALQAPPAGQGPEVGWLAAVVGLGIPALGAGLVAL